MLGATMLAALLMAAILSVLGAVGRSAAVLAQPEQDDWAEAVIQVLLWDVANARTLRTDERPLMIQGVGAMDGRSGRLVHRPVWVVYELRRIGERSWLVRRQTEASGGAAGRSALELVAPDIEKLSVEVLDAVWDRRSEEGEFRDVRRVRVSLASSDPARGTVERTVVLR